MRHPLTRALVALCLFVVCACSDPVSAANYEKITNGMTPAQIEELMGKATETGGVSAMGVGASTWVYKDGDRSITVVFLNDKVTGKSKAGF